ncbi:MAG: hypothetical protein ACE5IG_02695 [Dehalococcoidia bacterium]
MSEKRMLIVPAQLVSRIDENRGDLSREDFLSFLLESQLEENGTDHQDQRFVTWEALQEFEHSIKELLHHFLEFVVSYELELGKASGEGGLGELTQKLQELQGPAGVSQRRSVSKARGD